MRWSSLPMTFDDELPKRARIDRCDHCDASVAGADGQTLRCACGSLLARYAPGGIELKCRRCKRTVVVALDAVEGTAGSR